MSQAQYIKDFRRQIHQHPELSWQEQSTSELIYQVLTQHGIKAHKFDKSGVVADIVGSTNSSGTSQAPVKILRADIDALPIHETTELEYASVNDGVMHACGHDFHTASVLGAGLIIHQLQDTLQHPVRLIFQPAEESIVAGSPYVIEQDVLQDACEIYAMHVEPRLEVGKIGIREGAITSAADIITITLTGNGGHSSRPHLTADIIQAISAIVMNTTTIFSRVFDPRSVVSLTWGKVSAGEMPNVIPSQGVLQGTLRTTEIAEWECAETVFRKIVESVTLPYGTEVEINYRRGVPPVINDTYAVHKIEHSILAVHGSNALYHAERSLGGEDFAWYLREQNQLGEKIVGAMMRIGAATPGKPLNDIHQPNLVVDEKVLDCAIPFLAHLLLKSEGLHD